MHNGDALMDQPSDGPHQPAYLPLRERPDPRRRYRRITAEDTRRTLKLHAEGLPNARIAKILDRDPALVRRILNKTGIETPKLRWNGPKALKLLNDGVPVEEVSRIVGKPVRAIRQYAARHGFRSG